MRLPTNSGREQALFSKKWRKSKGGMFEIFFSFFRKNIHGGKKFGPTTSITYQNEVQGLNFKPVYLF